MPAFSDSKPDDELAVEATHAANVQSLIASSFASHEATHPGADVPREANENLEHWHSSDPSSVGRENATDPDDTPLWKPETSGQASGQSSGQSFGDPSNDRRRGDVNESTSGDSAGVSLDGTDVPPNRLAPKHEQDAMGNREAASVSESSWKTPSAAISSAASDGWSTTNSRMAGDEPLQPIAAREDQTVEPATQSQWLTSSHSRTSGLPTDNAEESFHTEPMNRQSGAMFPHDQQDRADEGFSPLGRFENTATDANDSPSALLPSDSVSDIPVEESSSHQEFTEEGSSDEDENLLADLIRRSEGPASHWFADYTANQTTNDESSDLEELEFIGDSEDNHAILERLNQYVRNSNSTEDEISAAIAESQYNGLDPESNALSLARMLINELDSATHSDADLANDPSGPDPLVESKRLVGVSTSEEGSSDDDSQDDYPSSNVEMRRKEFDERAFRDSFADSPDAECDDPNADDAAYSIQSETNRVTESRAVASPEIDEQDEEDSVEAYMNQLLRRMGQEPISAPKATEEPAQPVASKFSEPKPQEITREKPEIVRPKRTHAELEVPMDQMRELANQSAESAISTSNRKGAKELRARATLDGVQAGVVVVCAGVFFYCGMTSSNLSLVWNTAGTLAVALSGFFFYEMFRKFALVMKNA